MMVKEVLKNQTNQTRFDFVDLLKTIAIVLIINSHAKWMYPDNLSALGIGGAWGCALFFFVSGFTMANMKTDGFLKYVIKRALRIYPAVWVWYAVSWNFIDGFQWVYLLWPQYWFLRSILIYYLLLYPILKYAKDYLPYLIGLGVIATMLCFLMQNHNSWIIDMNTNPVTMIWYFAIMVFGAYTRNCNFSNFLNTMGGVISTKFLLLALLSGSFIGCYGIKFIAQKYDTLIYCQILFPVFVFAACYLIGTMCRGYNIKNKIVKYCIKNLSSLTLEIYIVQQLFIYDRFAEPITGAGALVATLFCAIAINFICKHSFGKIKI